jgi:hypothetical protein
VLRKRTVQNLLGKLYCNDYAFMGVAQDYGKAMSSQGNP